MYSPRRTKWLPTKSTVKIKLWQITQRYLAQTWLTIFPTYMPRIMTVLLLSFFHHSDTKVWSLILRLAFGKIFIIGCTGSYQNGNLSGKQWKPFIKMTTFLFYLNATLREDEGYLIKVFYCNKNGNNLYEFNLILWKKMLPLLFRDSILRPATNACQSFINHIDGLVQERRNSIANALELRLSCTNQLISAWYQAEYLTCFLADYITALSQNVTLG